MEWKNQLTRTSYLVLFIILITVGVGTASALISITLSGDVVIIGFLDMMGDKITNVGEPTASTDAATKGYVDSSPTTDTLAGLGCTNNQVAQFVGSTWVCVDKVSDADALDGIDSDTFLTKTEHNAIPDEDTLGGLGCSTDKIARWNGASWECVTITLDTNPNIVVDSTDSVGQYTSIAIGTDGNPVTSYYDNTNADLKVVHCGNTTCNFGNTITTVDSTGDVGKYTSIAIGTNGNPVISYWDETNADLKFVVCLNTTCSSSQISTLDSAGDVGLYTSIATASDGKPVISYRDDTNTALKVVHCGNTTCNFQNTITTVDAAGSVGTYTSIAIGTDGNPVISYFDFTNFALKVIHCGNTTCSGGNSKTIVDSAGFVGQHTSIAIGTNGNPVISYWDETNADLKVVHCGNTTCSGGNTITTLDSTDVVGQYTSIAIGTDGNPVISYYDNTNDDLKVVNCHNPTCSGGNTITTLDSTDVVGLHTSIAIGLDNNHVISYYSNTNGDLKMASEGVILTFE